MLVVLQFPGDVAVLRLNMFVDVNVCVSEILGITEEKCFCFLIHKPHEDVRFVVPCTLICSWLFVDWVACGNVCFGDMQIEFVDQERYHTVFYTVGVLPSKYKRNVFSH